MKYINVFVFYMFLCCAGYAQGGHAYMTSPDGGMYAFDKIKRLTFDTAQVNVYYKLLFRPDSTKTDEYRKGQTVLMVSDKYTRFGDYYRIKADSIIDYLAASKRNAHDEKANEEFYDAANNTSFGFITLNDLAKSQITVQVEQLNKYQYTYPAPEFNWTLQPGDTLINNIPCKKVTCRYAGRNFIAWYAESVPLPYGPYVFGGLPGLIMRLYDDKLNWIFTNNGISKATPHDIMYLYKEKKYRKVTREKALSAYRNEKENYLSLAIESGEIEVVKKGPDFDKHLAPRPSNMLELEW